MIVNGGRGLTELPMTPVGFAMAAGYWVVFSWQGTGRRQVLGGVMGSWFCFLESVVDNAGLKVVKSKAQRANDDFRGTGIYLPSKTQLGLP